MKNKLLYCFLVALLNRNDYAILTPLKFVTI
jgi:hypothetical protein